MLALPLTLISLLAPFVLAGDGAEGSSCAQNSNQLLIGTYQLSGDCGPQLYCSPGGTCTKKGCRKDEFPFGYTPTDPLPPRCANDEFCPDEGDKCQKLLAVGSPCQMDRDDECEADPNNFAQLRGPNNNNGSICLNFQCMFANVTLGTRCIVENIPYIAYGKDTEFINIVSRDNCVNGLYCDAAQTTCMQQKGLGTSCTSDKECQSNNCKEDLTCGVSTDAPTHLGSYVYVIVGVGIFGGILGTLVGLFFFHRRTREAEREKRVQYWREQNAFRQNIMQMRETARASLLSLPLGGNATPRGSVYSRDGLGSEDSHVPILHAPSHGSSLRYATDGEDDLYEPQEQPVTVNQNNNGRNRRF